MKNYNVAIVGGGPAGMMAGIAAGKHLNNNPNIVLIEKTDSLGKKLLLTGGRRCNIANASPIKNQLDRFRDKNFLKHSFYSLTNEQLLAIFKEKGLEFKIENGRYFPVTDDSKSILNILKDYLKELKIDILLNSPVKSVSKNEKDLFKIKTSKSDIFSEKIIIATGGITYPQTGSSGDGYRIATGFGHSIATLKPGLIPLKVKSEEFRKLSGITLEDVEVSFKQKNYSKNNSLKNKNKIVKVQGNVLITHFGLSGPGILDLSNFIIEDIIQENHDFNDSIFLDLVPKMSEEELRKKIANDSQKYGKTKIKNYMKFYLKNRFIDFFLNIANVDGNVTLSNMRKKDKNKLISTIKQLAIEIDGILAKEVAMITCGGVNIKEISPKTMESKLTNGLYIAGELLEPYGPTGGYNLQLAFSTGYLAGKSCTNSIKY